MAISGELRIVALQPFKSPCVLAKGNFTLRQGAVLSFQSCHNDFDHRYLRHPWDEEEDDDDGDIPSLFGDDDDGLDDEEMSKAVPGADSFSQITAAQNQSRLGSGLNVQQNLTVLGGLTVVNCHTDRGNGGAVHVGGGPSAGA